MKFLLSLALAFLATAPLNAQVAESAEQKPVVHLHSAEHDAAKIREHRLLHLVEKISVEPAVLKERCRYESDISTPPPHKRVALTFDDGPEPEQTELILAVLRKYKIRAAFFMVGEKVTHYPELVAKVLAEGQHVVGNHSWSHPNFHSINPEEQAKQVTLAEQALGSALKPKLFRYPYGNSSCETNALLKEKGYETVGWHVDSCDWAFDKTGVVDVREATECGVLAQHRANYVDHVVSAVRGHNGGIVLMHEIHPNTVKKLEEIIQRLVAEGFTFGSIDDSEFASALR